jgi:hypothetical protein
MKFATTSRGAPLDEILRLRGNLLPNLRPFGSNPLATARTGLGWQLDHFLGYFAATSIVWLGWPKRPFVVGGFLMVTAVVLKALQVFSPDRYADFYAALFGACGALTQALLVALLIRLPPITAIIFVIIQIEYRTVVLLECFILFGFLQYAVSNDQEIRLISHEAAECILRRADNWLVTDIKTRVDQYWTSRATGETRGFCSCTVWIRAE